MVVLKAARDFKFWKTNLFTLNLLQHRTTMQIVGSQLWKSMTYWFFINVQQKKLTWQGEMTTWNRIVQPAKLWTSVFRGAVCSINSTSLRDVMLCTVVEIYHFWRSLLPHSFTIKIELAGSSEVSAGIPTAVFCCI